MKAVRYNVHGMAWHYVTIKNRTDGIKECNSPEHFPWKQQESIKRFAMFRLWPRVCKVKIIHHPQGCGDDLQK